MRTSKLNKLQIGYLKFWKPNVAIEVIYKLRNKQKDYLISHETPCRYRIAIIVGKGFYILSMEPNPSVMNTHWIDARNTKCLQKL